MPRTTSNNQQTMMLKQHFRYAADMHHGGLHQNLLVLRPAAIRSNSVS